MIDIEQLTQEQRWGLAFATLTRNEAREIDEPELTYQQYAEHVFRSACDSYYASLLQRKQEIAIQQFNALTPEQQAAFLEQLQVPDIVPD